MPRPPSSRCNVSWRKHVGTTVSGNLPQYKVPGNNCNIDMGLITYPDVDLNDFRHYHIQCPYATQASIHLARDVDASSATYWQFVDISSTLADHTATQGVMVRDFRGPRQGWLCVDDACPYYISTGKRYFYI